jgi:hypothetical protein
MAHYRDTENTEKPAELMNANCPARSFFHNHKNSVKFNFFLVFSVLSVSLW